MNGNKKAQVVSGFGFAMQLGAMMDEIRRAQGVTEEEFHVLGTPGGRPHLERMIAGLKSMPIKKAYLSPLYQNEEIFLTSTDGTATIARVKNVFAYGIDADFVNWGLNAPARPTERTEVVVHELIADGTFADIYGSLDRLLAELCLTQSQIIGFCVKHKDKLRKDGYGTFFLLERDDEFFVAHVVVNSDGRLHVYVNRFSNGGVWGAEVRRRFVLPQLKPLVASAS